MVGEFSQSATQTQEVGQGRLIVGQLDLSNVGLVYLEKVMVSCEVKASDADAIAEAKPAFESRDPESDATVESSIGPKTTSSGTSYTQVAGIYTVGKYLPSDALDHYLAFDLSVNNGFFSSNARNIKVTAIGREVTAQ